MRFSSYIIFLTCVGIVLYFMGYTPLVSIFNEKGTGLVTLTCQLPDTAISIQSLDQLQPNCDSQTVVMGAIFMLITVVAIIVGLITGFSALYIIAAVILMAVVDFFVFPMSFLLSAPDLIRYPSLVLYNALTVLAAVSFIRGGDA